MQGSAEKELNDAMRIAPKQKTYQTLSLPTRSQGRHHRYVKMLCFTLKKRKKKAIDCNNVGTLWKHANRARRDFSLFSLLLSTRPLRTTRHDLIMEHDSSQILNAVLLSQQKIRQLRRNSFKFQSIDVCLTIIFGLFFSF